ncbi:MAG TPA: HAMP domain-containing sensor histidine kinase [Bacteroidales bacterium]|nr:HAMP domain-containing sensor histidine kinase [Bacteroidales bacterium]
MKNMTDEALIQELTRRLTGSDELRNNYQSLMDELNLVNKKLEESEALKSHFISNITNEIINPFASILGLSKAILSVDKENWKKVLSMVALIYTEAFNLDFQLKNIFAAARIEAGEMNPEIAKVDIFNLIRSIVERFKIEAKKKKVKIDTVFEINLHEARSSFFFKTDVEKLNLILLNLLNNALKYSFEEGLITIKVWQKEGDLFISVKDRGIGLSDEHKKIIFDRFRRVDSAITSTNRGHGLGLSINKALLDILDGQINIESQPGEGSNFIIQLPETPDDPFLTADDDNELFFNDKQVF